MYFGPLILATDFLKSRKTTTVPLRACTSRFACAPVRMSKRFTKLRSLPAEKTMARPGRDIRRFALNAPAAYGLRRDGEAVWLAVDGEPVLDFARMQLTGLHNAANALAALALCEAIGLPRAALSGEAVGSLVDAGQSLSPLVRRPFEDPDPFHEPAFANPIAAKRAIADAFGTPLGRLSPDQRAAIDAILRETLERRARALAAPRAEGRAAPSSGDELVFRAGEQATKAGRNA